MQMILTKLQEALAEVDPQRRALDKVEAQLRSMIAELSGIPVISSSAPLSARSSGALPLEHPPMSEQRNGDRDKLDDIADILRAEGKPLHITEIAERFSEMTGTKVSREKIEPGMNRHIQKTKKPRIAKFAPSTFGLPEWKTKPNSALANIA